MCHTAIFQLPIEEQLKFKNKLEEVLTKTNDDILNNLLWDNNWRCSLVGSWLIFLKNRTQFINDIGKLLIQNRSGTIGYCYALAKFGTKECSQYLTEYLNSELRFEKFPNERFQDIALFAIIYIDNKNKTDFSKQFKEPNGLWTKFVEFEFMNKFKLEDSKRWGNVDEKYNDFASMLEFMNKLI